MSNLTPESSPLIAILRDMHLELARTPSQSTNYFGRYILDISAAGGHRASKHTLRNTSDSVVELVALSNIDGLLALHRAHHDAVVSLERVNEVLLLGEGAAGSSNRLDALAEAVICREASMSQCYAKEKLQGDHPT
eukprot:498246-Hanusia_phi.AAC.2